MKELRYQRWTYRSSRTPLRITNDKLKSLIDWRGNFLIPSNSILVKIHYASLNPIDYKLKDMAHLPSFRNKGMGKDFSGEIVALGCNVENFKIGDMVQGFHSGVLSRDGTFSEYLLINTKRCLFKSEVAKVPQYISLEEAAAWPLVLGTAMLMLDKLPVRNKKVLVLGGATSVGRYVMQLLRFDGAREIVVSCSPRSQELVKALGATKTINYGGSVVNQVLENVTNERFDYVFDCWGGKELFPNIKEILTKGGVYRTIVGDKSPSTPITLLLGTPTTIVRSIASSLHLLDYSYRYVLLGNKNPGWITKAQQYVASGKVKIFIDKIYAFDELPEAIEYIETGQAQGKLVIQVN
ncbi:Protein YIM1-2 [Candida viswanathii]|uniref:Protein YIM1-2 n=1 Tax=Candida viswanathii TaxID=5486 RepID=A0A367XMP8_9ASCO|nr:Protein YIM1-2 [Candida viswanathii]